MREEARVGWSQVLGKGLEWRVALGGLNGLVWGRGETERESGEDSRRPGCPKARG